MALIKCPRCELNYIQDTEGYCKICKREMKGEVQREEIEMCTICNEAPALPGKDGKLSAGQVSEYCRLHFSDEAHEHIVMPKVVYISNLYFEEIKDAGVTLDIENAKCVMHYDGEILSTEETNVTKADFENKSYKPYEFYILVVE